jgi:very-short-patch-repair endonuclease
VGAQRRLSAAELGALLRSGKGLGARRARGGARRERTPEELLEEALRGAGAQGWIREYRFDRKRRWRLDFAWPEERFGVEVHGGIWTQGRHTRGAGFERDREKMAEALASGWRVLEVTAGQVRTGEALAWILRIRESR